MLQLLSGPIFLCSLAIFFIGMLFQMIRYVVGLNGVLDRVAYTTHPERSIPGVISSIMKWLVPAGTHGWRSAPLTAVLFFVLHAGAVLVPIFLAGHTVILEKGTGVSLPMLPMGVADILTLFCLITLFGCAARRLVSPVLRKLSSCSDWIVILLTFLPFATGLMARFLWVDRPEMMIVHLVCGNCFLILAPFTKLSHIVLYFMSRAQIGMEFAIKRGGRARGGSFDW